MTLKLTFAPLSDVGRERSENQDAYGCQRLEGLEFFIVCDGMGGHRGGSTASRLAVATLEKRLEQLDDVPAVERMTTALTDANNVIYRQAQADRELRGMGTTAVVLAIDHAHQTAHYAHVGDSRIYIVRGDDIRQLTRDHTFVQRLIDDGILTEEAAEGHPQSNVIIRSLGGQEHVEVEPGDTPLKLEAGDTFVLCSDGLHGLVKEPEIAALVVEKPLDVAARELIALANERGGHDNITVELVRIGDRETGSPDTWNVLRPTPAPGTRLAKKAAERAELPDTESMPAQMPRPAETAPAVAAPPEAANAASTGITDYSAPEGLSSGAGTAVLIAVVAAIVLCAIMLWMVLNSSPSATARYAPEGSLPAETEAAP